MVLALSATDVRIRLAHARGTLAVVNRWSDRLQDAYVSIEDEAGLIETALDQAGAGRRVIECVPGVLETAVATVRTRFRLSDVEARRCIEGAGADFLVKFGR